MKRSTVFCVALLIVAGASYAFGRHTRQSEQGIIYRDGIYYGCTSLARSADDARGCESLRDAQADYPGMTGFSR